MDSPTSDQPRASGEETQRISSPTPTDLSDAMSSPRAGRKRTNDEMYKSGATGHGKKASVNQRPNTAPEKSQKALQSSQFARYGFHNDLPNLAQSIESAIGTLSTQASAAITVPDAPQTFVSQLQQLHDDLDRGYTKYVEELQDRDHKAHLELFDWDDLEDGYMKDMEPAIRVEQEIQAELARSYRVRSKTFIQRSC